MFLENRNQPISVEFRGCFPHAEVLIENINALSNLAPSSELELGNDKNLTQNLTQTSRKPHAETTKDPRFNVSP